MEYLILCSAALVVSGLTLFSGFGLGTVLTPVFAIFFPVPISVAAAAVVHLVSNLYKIALVGRSANKTVVIRFAVPAVGAAFLGAYLLTYTASLPVVASYSLRGGIHEITVLKLIIGSLIILFSALELMPWFRRISFDQRYLAVGGLLSGFFGGIAGMPGAFRSMFLIRAGLGRDEFIGTSVIAAVIVDTARILVYGIGFYSAHAAVVSGIGGPVLAATLAACLGAYIGNRILKKVTIRAVQIVVGVSLILLGSALVTGLI